MATTFTTHWRRRALAVLAGVTASILATVATASAETLLMPKRDFSMGVSEVVWGITTQANGTAFTLDYGDGTPPTVGNVADRSYIAFNHTYGASGVFTITLTVGAEVATVDVNVYNHALLSVAEIRNLRINKAIEDGLRFLWVNQSNRTTFDTNNTTAFTSTWGNGSTTSIVTLSILNHGYQLPNNNSAPTGIYPKYLVQRLINHIVSQFGLTTLTVQQSGAGAPMRDPCVGAGIEPAPCQGFSMQQFPGYATATAALALLASGAPDRMFAGVPAGNNAGYPNGKTIREIAQRAMNSVAFGQIDPSYSGGTDANNTGRGGWEYQYGNNSVPGQSDGSTVGWDVLALLDATASGYTIPAWVKTEFEFAVANGSNTNGSFDYNAESNPNTNDSVNHAKAGVRLQSLYYLGVAGGDARVTDTVNWINTRYSGNPLNDQGFACGNGLYNKGCGYGMFNVFKGLRLFGIDTLANVNRTGVDWNNDAVLDIVGDVDDWYADYEDWLVVNQQLPTSTTGGSWGNGNPLYFSCCDNTAAMSVALAELILAPVALVLPDPTLFSTVGLSPATATNPPGTSHTVTALAQSANKAPIPGATVDFRVISGPNVGKTGSANTGANGEATFTYTDTSAPPHGTDQIQAFIGNLGSNVVSKTWSAAVTRCDVEPDGDVDQADLAAIRAARGQKAQGANDPRDGNGDGRINVADYRYCLLRMTAQPAATAKKK